MKRFVAESYLARMLIVDMRPHLFFGTRYCPMAKTAALVAARLAWEALSLHEPVGLIVVPTANVIRPRRGKGHVLHMLQHLETCYQDLADRQESASEDVETLAQALEIAAANLRRGDEICAVSDFGGPDGPLAEAAKGLGDSRKLSAVIIEDAIFSEPVPAGRYPIRMADGDGRHTASVSNREARKQAQMASFMRSSLRMKLAQSGWKVLFVESGSLNRESRV